VQQVVPKHDHMTSHINAKEEKNWVAENQLGKAKKSKKEEGEQTI
jgi:hypothetical protein